MYGKAVEYALKDVELEGIVLNEQQVELVKAYADGKIDKETFIERAVKLS